MTTKITHHLCGACYNQQRRTGGTDRLYQSDTHIISEKLVARLLAAGWVWNHYKESFSHPLHPDVRIYPAEPYHLMILHNRNQELVGVFRLGRFLYNKFNAGW